MAIQRFTNTDIIVEISDREIEGVILKRKAIVQNIDIALSAKKVSLNLIVKYFGKNKDGTYADELQLPGITAYNKSLVADMTTLADVATGIDVCNSVDEYVDDVNNVGQKILNPLLDGKTYMYDFEMFAAMMFQPEVVATIYTQRIQYAASQGQLD